MVYELFQLIEKVRLVYDEKFHYEQVVTHCRSDLCLHCRGYDQ